MQRAGKTHTASANLRLVGVAVVVRVVDASAL